MLMYMAEKCPMTEKTCLPMRASTNIYMRKEDAGIVRMEASQLGYSSPAEFINALVNLRKSNKWSKLDVEILTVYHRLPEPIILTEEALKKAGYVKADKKENK